MNHKISIQFILVVALCIGITGETQSKVRIMTSQPAERRIITAEQKWLLLPVKNGGQKTKVEIRIQGKVVQAFDIELANEQPDWYAYLDISAWKGQQLELSTTGSDDLTKAFSLIKQENKEQEIAYHEPLRGQFHFSPKRGWNNDPNGMVYYKGEYHLFFQHNPYGVLWGNMHWGHAVSKDLIHWKEIGEALYPDSSGTMFSGSGIVDLGNTSGLGKPNDPAMFLFYTVERSWHQAIAYSLDGRKMQKLNRIAVPEIADGNRDPKVVWHEPTKRWVLVVYVPEANDQHSMHFLTSANLLDWQPASVLKGGKGDDRYLFECPEFFELPVEGSNEKKWVLTAANSEYAIGSFDGKTFTPETERLNGQLGRDFYAAQTFNNEPKGRRIEIGWWRTHTNVGNNSFNQSMSIPMELKLLQTPDGLQLSRTPVEELNSLRDKHIEEKSLKLQDGQTHQVEGLQTEFMEIRADMQVEKGGRIVWNIRGVELTYDGQKEELSVDGVKAPLKLSDNRLDLIIYADRTGLEIFANKGLLFMPINKNLDPSEKGLTITAKNGTLQTEALQVYSLKSIW